MCSMTVSLKDKTVLHLRAHHLLCIQNYRGHGYSSGFNNKMKSVIAALQNVSGAEVLLIRGADDLCRSCPHCKNGSCESDNPGRIDELVCEQMKAAPGDIFTWKLPHEAAPANVSPDNISRFTKVLPPANTLANIPTNSPAKFSPDDLENSGLPAQGLQRGKTFHVPVMTKELLEKCCSGCSWFDLCREILSN